MSNVKPHLEPSAWNGGRPGLWETAAMMELAAAHVAQADYNLGRVLDAIDDLRAAFAQVSASVIEPPVSAPDSTSVIIAKPYPLWAPIGRIAPGGSA